jgi:hypothetical protein
MSANGGLPVGRRAGRRAGADFRTVDGWIQLDLPRRFRYNGITLGVEVVLDPIGHNVIAARRLAVLDSVVARPRLAEVGWEPQAIPVDVRVRLVSDELPVLTAVGSTPAPASAPRPVGTLLDCHM